MKVTLYLMAFVGVYGLNAQNRFLLIQTSDIGLIQYGVDGVDSISVDNDKKKVVVNLKSGNDQEYAMGAIDSIYFRLDVSDIVPEIVTDAEGNEYHTVEIGDEIWLEENLESTTYNDGTPIENVVNIVAEEDYYNIPSNNEPVVISRNGVPTYYNAWAARQPNICPAGYHVPSRQEAQFLSQEIGDEVYRVKSVSGWSEVGTNEFGWDLKPLGIATQFGLLREGERADVWTTSMGGVLCDPETGFNCTDGYHMIITDDSDQIRISLISAYNGLQVKCIRD